MPKAPRIFVVEDDESIRMLLEVALRSSGYTVSAFPNAADALAEMENTVPDAAVLDIMLDGMDGITALKLMRANARLAGVPVMMLTAKDSENDKIIGISVVSFSDDEPYWSDGKTVINRILSAQSANVDTVSGATFSSGGIIEAVRAALNSAKN